MRQRSFDKSCCMTEQEAYVSESQREPSRAMLFTFASLVFTGYIVLDLLTPSGFGSVILAHLLSGLVAGQLALICVWGALVEGAFWLRLPSTVLLLVISWAALSFGIQLEDGGRIDATSDEIMGLGLVWFCGFAISYVPLKIAAWVFGWRIELVSRDRTEAGSRRYAIREKMLGTGIVAVALAIGRQVLPEKLPTWPAVMRASGLDDPDFLIAFLVFSVISLIVKLPCIWITLATPEAKVIRLSDLDFLFGPAGLCRDGVAGSFPESFAI